MYKSFRVKNFRCFKDLQINDLGRVNLIAGRNNTGKTALMEAMYLLAGNRDVKTLLRRNLPFRPRSMRDYEDETRSSISLDTIFLNFDKTNPIELTADTRKSIRKENSRVVLNISDVPEPALIEYKPFLELLDRHFSDFDPDLEVLKFDSNVGDKPLFLLLQNGHFRATRFKPNIVVSANFLYAREKIIPKVTSDRFSEIQGSKKLDTLINGLRVIEPRLLDLRIGTEDGRPSINADIGLSQLVSLNTLGDGMNRMSDMLLALNEVVKGAIFIDEIENGIHYTVQKDVWKAVGEVAREQDIQVFATTHSYEMIEAAHEAFKDDDPYEFRYHRLDRKPDGIIEAVTYNKFGMDAVAAFDFEHEVRG